MTKPPHTASDGAPTVKKKYNVTMSWNINGIKSMTVKASNDKEACEVVMRAVQSRYGNIGNYDFGDADVKECE